MPTNIPLYLPQPFLNQKIDCKLQNFFDALRCLTSTMTLLLDRSSEHLIASQTMTPVAELTVLERVGMSLGAIGKSFLVRSHIHAKLSTESLLEDDVYRGFPIVNTKQDMMLVGYITSSQLRLAHQQATSYPGSHRGMTCSFCPPPQSRKGKGNANDQASFDFRPWVEESPVTLPSDISMESVVGMFQRLGLRHVLLKRQGRLEGLITRHDCHYLIRQDRILLEAAAAEGRE